MAAINARYEAQAEAVNTDGAKSSESQDFEELMQNNLPPDVLKSWGIDVE